jgi:hypothetical protein
MKKYWFALFAAASLGPASVSAQNLDYNNVQGGLALYPSFGGQSLFGLDLQGTMAITPDEFLLGGFSFLTDDVDLTTIHAGGAYRLPVAEATDLYGGLTIEYQKVAVEFPTNGGTSTMSFNDTALGLRGGIRHQISPVLELGGQLRVVTGDMDYFGLRGTVQYLLNGRMSLLGEMDIYDNEIGLIGGLRFKF